MVIIRNLSCTVLDPQADNRLFQLALLVQFFMPLAFCFVKVSVLIMYLRIFGVLSWMRFGCIIGIVVTTVFQCSLAIAFGAMCGPNVSTGHSQLDFLEAFVSKKCDSTRILVVVQGAGSVIIDLFLLILPIPAVWTLQMPLKRKNAVLSMFLVGIW